MLILGLTDYFVGLTEAQMLPNRCLKLISLGLKFFQKTQSFYRPLPAYTFGSLRNQKHDQVPDQSNLYSSLDQAYAISHGCR